MNEDLVYYAKKNNLTETLKENPEYTKVFFKMIEKDGKKILSLSEGTGDELYFVSNRSYDDLYYYLRKKEVNEIKKRHTENKIENKEEQVKKTKQQDLFSFFKKG